MKGNFQVITLVVFIAAAVLGVLVFSGAMPIGGGNSSTPSGTVVLWGTLDSRVVNPLLEDFNRNNKDLSVKYVEKSTDTFDGDLLEALATGQGPDMFFLSNDLVYKYSNKIFTIPYQSLPLATFQNNFASGSEVFLNQNGVLAFPLTIDPLMMYYNRSMLDAENIINPPQYWDELVNLVPSLTKKASDGTLEKSAVALGQFSNISNAKQILVALLMQTGGQIISAKNGSLISMLRDNTSKYHLDSLLDFYTSFADPASPVYSWNRSFSSSSDAFSREELTFYFGFASEFKSLVNKNPNQNFSVAPFPQIKNSNFKLTFGRELGLAVSSASKNFNTTFTVAGLLSNSDFASKLASALGVAPARRDLLQNPPEDSYMPTFYASALFARAFIDPSPKDSNDIFRGMVEKVLSGGMTSVQAINDASGKLDLLLRK